MAHKSDGSIERESAQLDGQTIAAQTKTIKSQHATITRLESDIAQLKADLAVAQAGVSLIMDDEPIRDRRGPVDEVTIAARMLMNHMDRLAGNGSAIDLGDE